MLTVTHQIDLKEKQGKLNTQREKNGKKTYTHEMKSLGLHVADLEV